MRLLVCGSREIDDQQLVLSLINESPFEPDTIVHGGAMGVDSSASIYAVRNDLDVETHPIPDWVWETIGAKAGPMRNSYMVEHCDAVVAIWDGESSGTADTISQAETSDVPIYKAVCSEHDGVWAVDDEGLIEDDQQSLLDFTGDS